MIYGEFEGLPDFQWNKAEWKEFALVSSKYSHPNKDTDQIRLCKRAFEEHALKPVVGIISDQMGWLYECWCTHRELEQFSIKYVSMHKGHNTAEWEETSFHGEYCEEYLEWTLSVCMGGLDQVDRIEYCYDCEVIINFDRDNLCRSCKQASMYHFYDDYAFYEYKLWVRNYVYRKINGGENNDM